LGPGERRRQIIESGDKTERVDVHQEPASSEQAEPPAVVQPQGHSLVAFRLRHDFVPFSKGATLSAAALHEAIERVAHGVSAAATLSWIGPDDLFGVVAVEDKPEAEAFVRVLFDATSATLMVNGTMVSLTPRIGAVFNNTQRLNGASVLDAATIALSSTSDEIPSRMHSPQLAEEATRRTNLESELKQAIDDSAVQSTTQVALDLQDDTPADVFLSPRWSSATEGAVAPSTLMRLSQEASRSKHVASQMLAHGMQSNELTERPLWLPIDGSDLIDDAFIDHLVSMGVAGRFGVVVAQGPGLHLAPTIRSLRRLREQNVGIAIDGIGARGAIGVFDVANLGADLLIVDADTIRMASYRTAAQRALATLAALAHSYEMRVCSRGIDTDNLLAMAKGAGLDLALGSAAEEVSSKAAHQVGHHSVR